MDKKIYIEKIVSRIIDNHDTSWAMNINSFDWVPGVGLYGIFKAWKYTGNIRYKQFLLNWVDKHLKEAYKQKTVNSTAPMLTVLCVYEETRCEDYLRTCLDAADYILNEAPRTREGGLEHTVTEDVPGFKEQLWADTLFMVCIFLARLGKITGNEKYSLEACRQLEIHHHVLKDKESGLFFHGWNCSMQNWMSGGLWARANGWITASTVEILNLIPETYSQRKEIMKSLQEQVAALYSVQSEDGMFRTLLDYKDAYGETSATSAIAYGIKIGIKGGYISNKFDEIWIKAEEAVIQRISDIGEVLEVSTGTPVMPTLEEYKTIPMCPTLYGQGLVLMLLCS